MKLSELKRKLENCSNENERIALEKEIAIKEYLKAHNEKYKEYRKAYYKEYYKAHKDELRKYQSKLCLYNGESLTLYALVMRFRRARIEHPVEEAKKYLIETI